jgi:hypothetical protein
VELTTQLQKAVTGDPWAVAGAARSMEIGLISMKSDQHSSSTNTIYSVYLEYSVYLPATPLAGLSVRKDHQTNEH